MLPRGRKRLIASTRQLDAYLYGGAHVVVTLPLRCAFGRILRRSQYDQDG